MSSPTKTPPPGKEGLVYVERKNGIGYWRKPFVKPSWLKPGGVRPSGKPVGRNKVLTKAELEKAMEMAERQALVLSRAYGLNCYSWLEREVRTKDEHDKLNPVKPFPIKPYVRPMVETFDKEKTIFVIKSRQMTITWLAGAYALHSAQFFDHRLVLVISEKFEKSAAIVDRIRFMYQNQSEWMRALHPTDRQMRDMPIGTLSFQNGSKILALPEGEDQVRMYTASLVIMDESDFHVTFKKTYEACLPAIAGGGKLISLSTVRPGAFSKICGLIQ
jgi:hypothetical protein